MAMSDYLETKVINAVIRGAAFPVIESVYVALFTTDPGETGSTGTEIAGGSYQRQKAVFSEPQQVDGNATAGNEDEIDFGVAQEVWGAITHVALYDTPTGGNMLYHAPLTSAKLIEDGDSLRFAPGKLTVSQS